jgi:hypothetical protein
MRLIMLSLVAAAGLVSPGLAEERVTALPEIVIGGGNPANTERCVEVEIGASRSMDCLNRKLRREVDRVNPTINLPPIDARSPDTKIGVVNVPGVQQQYGRNFGVSVIPQRPAPPVFSSPLGPRR